MSRLNPLNWFMSTNLRERDRINCANISNDPVALSVLPRKVAKSSVRKSVRKVAKSSVRKSVRKVAKRSVRKSVRKVAKRSVRKSVRKVAKK